MFHSAGVLPPHFVVRNPAVVGCGFAVVEGVDTELRVLTSKKVVVKLLSRFTVVIVCYLFDKKECVQKFKHPPYLSRFWICFSAINPKKINTTFEK